MTGNEAKRKAEQIAELLRPFTEDERITIIAELPFCLHCFADDPEHKCQCWNDE